MLLYEIVLSSKIEFGSTQVCQNLASAWAEVSAKQISLPRTTELWEDNHASWGLLWKGWGWWHSPSHRSKMKINDWKPELQPNGRSLQTRCVQSCKLRVAETLSPHAFSRSLWDLLHTQRNVVTWMKRWGPLPTLKKHQTWRNILLFKAWPCMTHYCQQAIRVKFWQRTEQRHVTMCMNCLLKLDWCSFCSHCFAACLRSLQHKFRAAKFSLLDVC